MNLGKCSITRAEIRGALKGIKRAWMAGYRRLEVQLDSQVAVAILATDWEITINHVYREANHVTDFLASLRHSLTRGRDLLAFETLLLFIICDMTVWRFQNPD
ncbi:Putative ribonuclease H protein At1g65750 [Linum perenne]